MSRENVSTRTAHRLRTLITESIALGLDKLPPERELATQLNVSRGSLRGALSILEHEGLIVRALGRRGGTYIRSVIESPPLQAAMFDISSAKLVRDLNRISGVPQMLARQGRSSATRLVNASRGSAPANIATLLELDSGSDAEVVTLLRVRESDGRPWSLERMYVPDARFPGLLDRLPIESLYEIIQRDYGVAPHHFDEYIEVSPSDDRVAALLGVSVGAPVFALRRVTRDADDVPIEVSVDLFRADMTRLKFTGEFDHTAAAGRP